MASEWRAGRDADWTDVEAEGIPEMDEQPPGIDADTAGEGMIPPRDHPLGVDEVGVSATEEARGETAAERAARQRPDTLQRLPEDSGGRLVEPSAADPKGEAVGEWERQDTGGVGAEESAIQVVEE